MTTAAHTPAPWLITDRTVYALNEKGVNRFFCAVQDAHTPADELEANAHLMAAAPELLAALISARMELELFAAEEGEHYNNPELNAAIAKATGA